MTYKNGIYCMYLTDAVQNGKILKMLQHYFFRKI